MYQSGGSRKRKGLSDSCTIVGVDPFEITWPSTRHRPGPADGRIEQRARCIFSPSLVPFTTSPVIR
ncbi:hypothetical protein AG1IA_07264 [Rhizoctonia solani AG-1 IA]|uniref:Uncharacterized protein n=1 Tax=Thanatephorus cucumeris (strain AG1-IA) TaxID=983506 RepID=L8WQV1_THACA|nr:hypothetical protein AG1IA_07264 [Rhizoctonia solani AG-1 IA]